MIDLALSHQCLVRRYTDTPCMISGRSYTLWDDRIPPPSNQCPGWNFLGISRLVLALLQPQSVTAEARLQQSTVLARQPNRDQECSRAPRGRLVNGQHLSVAAKVLTVS